MANEHLDNLVSAGQLKEEPPIADEVSGLIRSAVTRLADAKNEDLSLESRFDLAYNAAHALSRAGLRSTGYRSNNRFLVFQCLEHTLGIPVEQWRVLDEAHRRRNLAEYEGEMDVDEALVAAMIRVTEELTSRIKAAGDGAAL